MSGRDPAPDGDRTPADGDPVPDEHPDLAGGDPEAAFARLFDTHARALRSYLAGRAGSQAADDLVAETFLLALRKRATYDPARGPVRPWLYGIATNVLRTHLRQEARALSATTRAAAATMPDDGTRDRGLDTRTAERLDAQRGISALADALARLPVIDRDVLLLSSWAELEPTEIGQALGIPASTVRSRLHRLRRRLRTVFAERHDGTRPDAGRAPLGCAVDGAGEEGRV